LSIDASRDVANKNELIIAVRYFDPEAHKILDVVYEVIEQNQTKSQQIFESIKNLFQINNIKFSTILTLMTDNANGMQGENGGVIAHFKGQNNSIFSYGCLCHKINLILVNLLKWISNEATEDPLNIPEEFVEDYCVVQFVSSFSGYFNYSYKRFDDYVAFSTEYIREMKHKDSNLYNHIKEDCAFPKIPKYSECRWLSLGKSLENIQLQWTGLLKFFEKQLLTKTTLKLTKEQANFLRNQISLLKNNEFKFLFALHEWICGELNNINELLQSQSSQLHIVWLES